jgi:hypothetical protein
MPTYRCFCMTTDNRIITGGYINAKDVASALEVAHRRWHEVPSFHAAEVWLGSRLMYPPAQMGSSAAKVATERRQFGRYYR